MQVVQSSQEHVPNRAQWDSQMGHLPSTLQPINDPSQLSEVRASQHLADEPWLCLHEPLSPLD